MLPAVGDFVQPLAHLAVHVRQIGERAPRAEVAPKISDSAFDLSLFPGRRYVTGTREEAIFTSESQEARMESNQVAIVLSHGGCKIVVPKLASDAGHLREGMQVATHESFEALTMGELDVKLAAVAFHQAEGVKLAQCAAIIQCAEVAPIDIEAVAGRRLHADIGSPGGCAFAQRAHVILHDGHAAIETLRAQPLLD